MARPIQPYPNRIRTLRIARGLTLSEVATSARTTPTQIARLEKGLRRLTPEWESRIAGALQVSKSDLIVEQSGEFYESKLLPNPEDLPADLGRAQIDRDFLVICFETGAVFWDEAKNKNALSPRVIFLSALILHDLFNELYQKVGKSEELLAALRQQFFLNIGGIGRAYGETNLFGRLKNLDAKLALFRSALEPDISTELPDDDTESDQDDSE